MVDITPNATVYPSSLDVAETEKDGRFAREQRHVEYVQNWLENGIVSGFVLPATDPDLTITVPLGEAVIDGHRVEISASTDVLLTDAATNHIFLQLSVDGSGDVDGVDMVFNTTGAVPVRSVKIGEADTVAGAVTATRDSRSFNVVKAGTITGLALNLLIKTFSITGFTIPSITPGVVTGATVTIPIGFFERQTTPKVFFVAYGNMTSASGAAATYTFWVRLNTVNQKSAVFNDLAVVQKSNFAIVGVLDLDETIANTIDVTAVASAGAGNGVLDNFEMAMFDIGQAERL